MRFESFHSMNHVYKCENMVCIIEKRIHIRTEITSVIIFCLLKKKSFSYLRCQAGSKLTHVLFEQTHNGLNSQYEYEDYSHHVVRNPACQSRQYILHQHGVVVGCAPEIHHMGFLCRYPQWLDHWVPLAQLCIPSWVLLVQLEWHL